MDEIWIGTLPGMFLKYVLESCHDKDMQVINFVACLSALLTHELRNLDEFGFEWLSYSQQTSKLFGLGTVHPTMTVVPNQGHLVASMGREFHASLFHVGQGACNDRDERAVKHLNRSRILHR